MIEEVGSRSRSEGHDKRSRIFFGEDGSGSLLEMAFFRAPK
jgi:hypothetical protein